MRDINRIEPIMKTIEEIWKQVPDERFFQFMLNLYNRLEICRDPFFIEDDKTKEMLDELLLKMKGNK